MDIPFDLLYIVASFYTKPKMKLLDWIPEDELDWYYLAGNPNAIDMIEMKLQQIEMKLQQKPSCCKLLLKLLGLNKSNVSIDWDCLSENPNAVHLLEKYPDKIHWGYLSKNPNALHLLEKNIDYN
jgi:hypothetical protein